MTREELAAVLQRAESGGWDDVKTLREDAQALLAEVRTHLGGPVVKSQHGMVVLDGRQVSIDVKGMVRLAGLRIRPAPPEVVNEGLGRLAVAMGEVLQRFKGGPEVTADVLSDVEHAVVAELVQGVKQCRPPFTLLEMGLTN